MSPSRRLFTTRTRAAPAQSFLRAALSTGERACGVLLSGDWRPRWLLGQILMRTEALMRCPGHARCSLGQLPSLAFKIRRRGGPTDAKVRPWWVGYAQAGRCGCRRKEKTRQPTPCPA